jgi:hypothetical protein
LTLLIFRLSASAEPIKQLAQGHQIDRSKCRPSASHKPECVRHGEISECGGNRAKPRVVACVNDPILAPMRLPADQVELATAIRMKRMCDAYLAPDRALMTCS